MPTFNTEMAIKGKPRKFNHIHYKAAKFFRSPIELGDISKTKRLRPEVKKAHDN